MSPLYQEGRDTHSDDTAEEQICPTHCLPSVFSFEIRLTSHRSTLHYKKNKHLIFHSN